ncbi:glycosyltransferase family 4 protein [Candidatus Shapirobacteria bacterium]|nr:glycosyltransferase family 4 protein [Candidatus Shapirobacteria bacterium]
MEKRNQIGIDISPLKDANRFRGVGFYTRNLLQALKKETENNPKYSQFKINLIDRQFNNSTIKQFSLIHYPYFDIFFPTLPEKKNTPLVVTVHDLTPLVFPEYYPTGIRGKINWLRQKRKLKRVEAIITDSQNSKKDIIHFVGYPAEKVFVIYLGGGEKFKKIKAESLKKVREKYRLPEKFALYVGDVNWNKNVPGLVKACEKIGVPLAIVGKQAVSKNYDQNHPENQDLAWLQKKAQKLSSIFLLGFVEEKDLAPLYNLATVYCQPSFYEGFGMPVVEAMACGCPVVCSNQGSLPEIGGEAVVYFNPYQKGSLEKVLKKVWEDKVLRKKLSQKSLNQAKKFSWQKCARETLNVYQEIIKL